MLACVGPQYVMSISISIHLTARCNGLCNLPDIRYDPDGVAGDQDHHDVDTHAGDDHLPLPDYGLE